MPAPKMPPPRLGTPPPPPSAPRSTGPVSTPPVSSASVVPIRPKPPAFPSQPNRPVIIEEDIVNYLVQATIEQRWRILSRVAVATHDETPSSGSPTAALQEPGQPGTASLPPERTTPEVQLPVPEAAARADGPPQPSPGVPASARAPAPAESSAVDHEEELFQTMRALAQFENAPAGAKFCLEVALAAVPCVAGLVHLRDSATGDLIVVHANGPRADALLGMRTPPADSLVANAMRARKPTVVTYGSDAGAGQSACPRHAFFEPWSVVVVPVVASGQLLGLFEMIDPVDGNVVDEVALDALGYVAGRLGNFLAEFGV